MSEKLTISAFLKQLSFFSGFSDKDIRDLSLLLTKKSVEKGDFLIREDEPGRSCFIIEDGRFEVSIQKNEEHERIGIINSGEMVGEMALISNDPRNSSVKATRNSTVYELKKKDFEKLIKTKHSLLLNIANTIINRTRRYYKKNTLEKQVVVVVGDTKEVSMNLFIDQCHAINATQKELKLIEKGELLNQCTSNYEIKHYLESLKLTYGNVVIYFNTLDVDDLTCLMDFADFLYVVSTGNKAPKKTSKIMQFVKKYKVNDLIPMDLILLHDEETLFPKETCYWVALNLFTRIHHVRLGTPAHIKRILRFFMNKAVAVVLSGGGFRGVSYLGVFEAFEALDIPVDMVCAVSVGTAFGAFLSMEYSVEKQKNIIDRLLGDFIESFSELTIPKYSILAGKKFNETIKKLCGDSNVEDAWINLSCPAVNFSQKKLDFFEQGKVWEIVRSSASLPGFFPPTIINGDLYIDGGILNNIPVSYTRSNLLLGSGTILSVSFHKEKVIKETFVSPDNLGISKHVKNYFKKDQLIKLPSIFEMLVESLTINSDLKAKQEIRESDVNIEIDTLGVSLSEKSLDKLYKLIPHACKTTLGVLKNHSVLNRIPFRDRGL